MIPHFEEIVSVMHEYQKTNNITKMCLTNVQYLYDSMNSSGIKVKPIAVIVLIPDKENEILRICNHVVLKYNNKIVEPSYEIGSLENTLYYEDYSKLPEYLKNDRETIKKTLKNHIDFINYTKRMETGDFIITDKDYYNKQADYVEKKFINNIQYHLN